MDLHSMFYQVTSINKTTKAQFWSDIRVGDIIRFNITLKSIPSYSGHRQSTYVTCEIVNRDIEATLPQGQVIKYLKYFDIQQVITFKGIKVETEPSLE